MRSGGSEQETVNSESWALRAVEGGKTTRPGFFTVAARVGKAAGISCPKIYLKLRVQGNHSPAGVFEGSAPGHRENAKIGGPRFAFASVMPMLIEKK
jgi:hypothetical protein